MIYTLNGPGPLRGLPSIQASDVELGQMRDFAKVDQAIERFNLTPLKRIIGVEALGRTDTPDVTLALRGLASRGFSIFGITYGASTPWLNLATGVVAIVRGREPWIGYKVAAFVQQVCDKEDLAHRTLASDLRGIPKYLEISEDANVSSEDVLRFLHDSEYSWNVRDTYSKIKGVAL